MRSPRNLFRSAATPTLRGRSKGEVPAHAVRSLCKNIVHVRLGALFKGSVSVGPTMAAAQPGMHSSTSISAADTSRGIGDAEDPEQAKDLSTSRTFDTPPGFTSSECHLCDCSVDANDIEAPSVSERSGTPPSDSGPASRKLTDVELDTGTKRRTPFHKMRSLAQRIRPRRGMSVTPRTSVPPTVISDDCWLGWDVCQAVVKGEHVVSPMGSLMGQV